MIRFANTHDEPAVRSMWQECFDDSEEFMDLYFSSKYNGRNTLIRFHEGLAAASLQMHPYLMTFYGESIPICYLSGICTLPSHRGKGYARELIKTTHRELHARGVPLAVLIPASAELYGYYARSGYAKVFESDDRPIPLGEILDRSATTEEAYSRFDAIFRKVDFCIQKSPADFAVITAEYIGDGRPVKTNLAGAAYLVDHMPLLEIYAKNNPELSFRLHLKGAEGDPEVLLSIANGSVDGGCEIHIGRTHAGETHLGVTDGDNFAGDGSSSEKTGTAINGGSSSEKTDGTKIISRGALIGEAAITADKPLLTELLFGHKTSEMPEPYRSLFPEHRPVMNLMLE